MNVSCNTHSLPLNSCAPLTSCSQHWCIFRIAAIKTVSVTASILQYACFSVVLLFVHLSLSLLAGEAGRPY